MQQKNINLEYVDVDILQFADYNPRKASEKQFNDLVENITKFGFVDPIIVNSAENRKNIIIGGHFRVRVARHLGIKHVPTVFLNIPDIEQEKELNVRLNKNSGSFDFDILANNFEVNDLLDWGFEEYELGIDLNLDSDNDDETEKKGIEIPTNPKSSLGDIYQLGDHFVMCGDSTKIDHVKKLMGDNIADIIVTDPPYNVSYEGKTDDALTIKNDKMDDANFLDFLTSAFTVANEFLKPGGTFYIWHADSESFNFRSSCKAVGWRIRQCLIWVKNHMVIGRQDYHWKHEPCLYGWKDGGTHTWNSDRTQTTVLEFDKPSRNGDHPTMKPVELFTYQIRNSSKEGQIVFDPFLGSGTSIIASENIGRKCYGLELDPKYVDVIINRWELHTGKKAIKI